MANIHIAALHDRIDEEHFEMRLHASAIAALQRRVIELEAAVRELRRLAFHDEDRDFVDQEQLARELQGQRRAPARRARNGNLQS
jgi:hypothetical protein